MHKYLVDFTRHWRPLLAASLGLGGGMALNPFVLSILAPHLVQAMGWSKADFALTGMVSGLAIISYPLIGRMADMFGTRRVALVGMIASALSYALIGLLDGPLYYYLGILVLQTVLGAATTGPVYLRPIVQNFTETRGVALALAVSTPALVAVIASPLLASLIEAFGWRTGCFVLSGFALTVGSAALALLPPERRISTSSPAHSDTSVAALFGNRSFWILIAITVLVTLPAGLAHSQLVLVLLDNGLSSLHAGAIVSLFAVGIIVGRLMAGLALDRFEAETVGAIALSLPAIGMLLLASPFDHAMVLAFAVLLIGLATGAEGDLIAYLIVKHFGLQIYSTALGLMFAAMSTSIMLGALTISLSIRLTGGYAGFLIGASVAILAGCALLLRLRGQAIPDSAKLPAS